MIYKARLEAMGRIVRTRVARLRVTKMYLSKKLCHCRKVHSRHHCFWSSIILHHNQNYFCRLVRRYHWLALNANILGKLGGDGVDVDASVADEDENDIDYNKG